MATTRRDFLRGVAAIGGVRALHLSMQAMGVAPARIALRPEDKLALRPSAHHGTKVVILGAGIAGLASAYELGKAGYDCTVLEARERVGGRNWTVRRGDRVEMNDGTRQQCEWDEGIYWNAGPARLPSHHETVLNYCRELGVPLQVEVNMSRSAMLQNPAGNGGKPVQLRQAVNDTRGAVAELLSKAIANGSLDHEIDAADKERMLAFLRTYGDLTPEQVFKGTTRSGYKILPGAGDQVGVARDPVPLKTLLDVDMWTGALFEESFDMQATMFQPVGGMDQFPKAFAKKLGGTVRYGAEVAEIRRHGRGVRVAYTERKGGGRKVVDADYCISTIPLKVLKDIPADFSPAYAAAIAAVEYGNSVKIAWQSRRFWEKEYQIYGGISFVKAPTSLVWYPSGDLFAEKGMLLGAYTSGPNADLLSGKLLQEQFDLSRAAIEALHPGHGGELQMPMAVAWGKVPYSLGIAAHYRPDQSDLYTRLGEPDGPFYFAGEFLSHVGAWQEGAILSAHRTLNQIEARRRAVAA